MAGPGSRIEKFGTVYTRVRGLLTSGAIKETHRPVWYDVYEAFPPAVEPKMNRAAPTQTPIDIMYIEDVLRAKYYAKYGNIGIIDLTDPSRPITSQRFIDKYMEIEKRGTEKGRIFKAVEESLKDEGIVLISEEERKRLDAAKIKEMTEKPDFSPPVPVEHKLFDHSSSSDSDSSADEW